MGLKHDIPIHVADPSQNVNVHLDQVFRNMVVRLMNWLIVFFPRNYPNTELNPISLKHLQKI